MKIIGGTVLVLALASLVAAEELVDGITSKRQRGLMNGGVPRKRQRRLQMGCGKSCDAGWDCSGACSYCPSGRCVGGSKSGTAGLPCDPSLGGTDCSGSVCSFIAPSSCV